MTIQGFYNKYQSLGFPGAVAQAGEPYAYDQFATSVEVKPGQGVYLDASSEWVLPTSDATKLLVTHIVGFDANSNNTAITTPTTNAQSEVIFAADTVVKAGAYGTFFVLAGEDVVAGDILQYDHTADEWLVYAPTDPTAADIPKATFVALSAGGDGEVVKVRHYGITNPITVTTAIT